jgi:hypothetical protein
MVSHCFPAATRSLARSFSCTHPNGKSELFTITGLEDKNRTNHFMSMNILMKNVNVKYERKFVPELMKHTMKMYRHVKTKPHAIFNLGI